MKSFIVASLLASLGAIPSVDTETFWHRDLSNQAEAAPQVEEQAIEQPNLERRQTAWNYDNGNYDWNKGNSFGSLNFWLNQHSARDCSGGVPFWEERRPWCMGNLQ